MKLLSWILAISVMMTLMMEAVAFHKATVCRQKTWLKSTENITHSLLSKSPKSKKEWVKNCHTLISRTEKTITWQRYPKFKKNHFSINLKGQL